MANNSLSKGLFLPNTHMIRSSNMSAYSRKQTNQLSQFLNANESSKALKKKHFKIARGNAIPVEDGVLDMLAT